MVDQFVSEIQGVFHDRISGISLAISTPEGGSNDPETFLFNNDFGDDDPLVPLLVHGKITSKELLTSYLKAISSYNPGEDYPCYRYFIGYFSSHGGCDEKGDVYILPDPTSKEKVYITEIADILNKSFFRRKKFICVLFFELCLQNDSDVKGTLNLPTGYDNFVIAVSGLQKAEDGRNDDDIGKWTERLDLEQTIKGNVSLTDLLADIKKDFPFSQYVSTTGHVFLNEDNVMNMYKLIDLQLNGATDRGVMLVAGEDSQGFNIDKETITTTFNNHNLQFKVIPLTAASDLLGLIKAITLYQYGTSFIFFSFYYTGYGNKDEDGRIYLQLGEEKVYLDWIVSLFKQRSYNHLPCFLLFELCLPKGCTTSTPYQLLLPTCNNFVVATSGLHEASVGRTPDDRGIWTQRLCQNINDTDQPLTVQLDTTGDQLPQLGAQYVNTTGLFYLKKPTRVSEDFETVLQSFETHVVASTSRSLGTPPKKILQKKPRQDDIKRLLVGGVASQWFKIGINLGVTNDKLKNIAAVGKSDETSLIMMTNKVNNLTWAALCTAVRNVNPTKGEEVMKCLLEDPAVFSNYPDV